MNTFEQMTQRGHERICFHVDRESGLRAIVAIHSTKLGNALGGTRRWHYATEADALYDVIRLSEGMTYKAACAGLPMGGAKSVVLLPKSGHAATEAEARALGRFVDTFDGRYIAAEDVGVTPQYVDWMALETDHVMGGINVSTGGDPSPYTAQGVINGMKASLAHIGMPTDFNGLTVAIQGVGHVGSRVARMLAESGAKVLAAEIDEEAMRRAVDFGVTPIDDDALFTTECDILAPCALGGVIKGNMIQKLGCKIVCGGANNILDDPDEDAAQLAKVGIVYAPDFVVNAGGLIRLAGLYLKMTEDEVDAKVAEIETTTALILREAATMPSTHAAAVAVARQRAAGGAKEQVHAG